jgi:adenylate cyclase
MPPPTSTEDSVEIAPWLAGGSSSPPPKRSNFGLATVKVLSRQAGYPNNVFARPRASESTLVDSIHSSSTGESSQRTIATPKDFFKSIKRTLSRPNLIKHSYDVPPAPPPTVAFSHDTSSTYSLYVPPSPPPPPSKKPRRSQKQKSSTALEIPPKELPGLPDGASMERILNVSVRDIVHPSALEDSSYGSLDSADTTSSPTFEDFRDNAWISHYGYGLAPPPPRQPSAFTNPFTSGSAVSLVPRRKTSQEASRIPQSTALLPVAPEPEKPRRLGSVESTALSDDPAPWTAPESWAVPKEGDDPEPPDYTSSEEDEEPGTSSSNGTLLSPQIRNKGIKAGKAPPASSSRKGSHAKVDPPVPVRATSSLNIRILPSCSIRFVSTGRMVLTTLYHVLSIQLWLNYSLCSIGNSFWVVRYTECTFVNVDVVGVNFF